MEFGVQLALLELAWARAVSVFLQPMAQNGLQLQKVWVERFVKVVSGQQLWSSLINTPLLENALL